VVAPPPSPSAWPAPAWQAKADGHVYLSSPTTARVGWREVVAVGTEAGYLELLDAATGRELPGWPRRVAGARGLSVAIESSPTIAWLDGLHAAPSVLVGTGSTSVDGGQTVGEVEAFRFDGRRRFVFHVGSVPGTATGVVSTPAVGDITGDGQLSIVFGSWDHHLYALTPAGRMLPGFPIDNLDTIWSSPALYHVRGPRRLEDVFIGSDASGRGGCYGGFVSDYSDASGRPQLVWRHCEHQTIWSSPAVGVLDGTGRTAVVVGTGFGETRYRRGSSEIYAFYADDGARVPGWPVRTSGPTPGSPAIGVAPGGRPMVVATSWDCAGHDEQSCFVRNQSEVVELSGSGHVVGRALLEGATALSSPVLVPLRAERNDDILVGAASGLYPIAAAPVRRLARPAVRLRFLFGVSHDDTVAGGCPVNNAVALVRLSAARGVAVTGAAAPGWYVIEACGGPPALHLRARILSYRLPVQPRRTVAALWAQFRGTPEHGGVVSTRVTGEPVPFPAGWRLALSPHPAPRGPAH
jgi:hypothetical protein